MVIFPEYCPFCLWRLHRWGRASHLLSKSCSLPSWDSDCRARNNVIVVGETIVDVQFYFFRQTEIEYLCGIQRCILISLIHVFSIQLLNRDIASNRMEVLLVKKILFIPFIFVCLLAVIAFSTNIYIYLI